MLLLLYGCNLRYQNLFRQTLSHSYFHTIYIGRARSLAQCEIGFDLWGSQTLQQLVRSINFNFCEFIMNRLNNDTVLSLLKFSLSLTVF